MFSCIWTLGAGAAGETQGDGQGHVAVVCSWRRGWRRGAPCQPQARACQGAACCRGWDGIADCLCSGKSCHPGSFFCFT